jgi:hypothetical protein
MVATALVLDYDVSSARSDNSAYSANGLAVGQTRQSRVVATLKKPNKNGDSETSQAIGR